jgi:thiamine-phosphate pyrophosphorylase
MKLPAPLLVITDRHLAQTPLEAIADAVGRGSGRWLLLRDKDLAAAERAELGARLAAIARRHGMQLSISADIGLAQRLGAGVHLQSPAMVDAARQRLGADAVIGVSAHSQSEVADTAAAGADYATLSPIFSTGSKPGYGPQLGVAALAAAAKLGPPILALGGIVAERVGPCLAAGAAGVAVMGGIMRSADPSRTVRDLLAACKAGRPRDPAVPPPPPTVP